MEVQIQNLQTLNNHTSDVTCCDFTAGCMLASGSMDKTVRLWEWKSGLGFVETSYSPLSDHKYGITCCTFSPQGTMLATCSRDGSTILWNTRNGSQLHKFPQVNGDAVRICKFSSDSFNLITAGDNGIICVWNLIHRTLIRSIQHHEDTVQTLSYTPDSLYIITACTLGVLKLYLSEDVRDSTIEDPVSLISIDDAHDLGVLCSDFSPVIKSDRDSLNNIYSLVTGGNDNYMKQWHIYCSYEKKNENSSAQIIIGFNIKEAHSSAITCIKYNHQGNMICSASLDKSMKIWNDEGTCLQLLDAHNRYINCIAFSRSFPILCSGSNDKTVKIWDLTGGSLNIDTEIIKPCTVLSHFGCGDLKGISSVHEDSIMLKNDIVENEVILLKILENLHAASINSLEFNLEGYLATASGDKNVRLLKILSDFEFSECDNSPLKNHHYQINGVTFITSKLLASCSLDGNICLWMIDQLNSRPLQILTKSCAGVKCIRSNKHNYLAAAYDDGTTALWSIEPMKATPTIIYPEHAEAATSCSFSPDDKLVCSASHNGDFRLYQMTDNNEYCDTEPVYVQDNAHDLGVQSIDFASRCDDIPIQYPDNMICHILATCGNDCYARIWKIIIPKEDNLHHRVVCSEWRTLTGHGSSLTCIRFPPSRGDLIATTSADMQTRIWSVYSGQCLHVLEHSTLVASCSFSFDGNFLATGCLDGKLYIWKLPSELIYDSNIVQFTVWNTKNVTDWSSEDVVDWLKDLCLLDNSNSVQQLIVKVHVNNVTGKLLIDKSDQEITDLLNIENSSNNNIIQNFLDELHWLRKSLTPINISISNDDLPHHFLCPITHDVMKDPVKCSDGFTYERRAINEWFLSGGKFVSPMTNQPLFNNEITSNRDLKKEIRHFLCANTN